jgi:hypothetical protein
VINVLGMTNNRPAAAALTVISAGIAASLLLAFVVLNLVTRTAELVEDSTPVIPVAVSVPAAPAGCVSAYTGQPGEDPTVAYCDQYELVSDDAPDPVADCLTEQGYHGIAGDGRAVIYSTAAAIEACVAEVDALHI